MNSEGATFILRTCDLPTNAAGENANGSTNNSSGSSYTWKNIDMKTILGTMYDKYDNFNIGLVNVVSTTQVIAQTFATGNNDKLGMLYMSGLRWLNSNYDTGTKTKTNNACIGYINLSSMSSSIGTVVQFNNLNLNSITKPNPNVNLTIFFNTVSTNAPNATTSLQFPQMAFQFKIYPIKIDHKIEADKEGSVNHRIIL